MCCQSGTAERPQWGPFAITMWRLGLPCSFLAFPVAAAACGGAAWAEWSANSEFIVLKLFKMYRCTGSTAFCDDFFAGDTAVRIEDLPDGENLASASHAAFDTFLFLAILGPALLLLLGLTAWCCRGPNRGGCCDTLLPACALPPVADPDYVRWTWLAALTQTIGVIVGAVALSRYKRELEAWTGVDVNGADSEGGSFSLSDGYRCGIAATCFVGMAAPCFLIAALTRKMGLSDTAPSGPAKEAPSEVPVVASAPIPVMRFGEAPYPGGAQAPFGSNPSAAPPFGPAPGFYGGYPNPYGGGPPAGFGAPIAYPIPPAPVLGLPAVPTAPMPGAYVPGYPGAPPAPVPTAPAAPASPMDEKATLQLLGRSLAGSAAFPTDAWQFQNVTLGGCSLDRDATTAFASFLMRNTGLRALVIQGSTLEAGAAPSVVAAVLGLRDLQFLRIEGCRLGEAANLMLSQQVPVLSARMAVTCSGNA